MPATENTRISGLTSRLAELTSEASPFADRLLKQRQILEQLYKAVTEDEKQYFNGLFTRMQFANTAFGVDKELGVLSHKLRILCNQVAHDEIKEVSEADFNFGISVLFRLCQAFFPDFVSPELETYLARVKVEVLPELSPAYKSSFTCVVDSWQQKDNCLEIDVVREDGSYCQLRLNNDDAQAGHNGKKWTLLAKTLWRYASLNVHEVTAIAGKTDSFTSNPQTLIVVEPDFLVDASALANCFSGYCGDPALFILNHLFSEASGEPQLQGSLVNGILDELVFNPAAGFQELFIHSMAALPLAMVSLGKEAALNIYNRIKAQHLPQLQQFVGTLQDSDTLLEPSYLCPDYGLQGRLDLLTRKGDSFSIVELKSGKAHPSEVWTGHQMQVIAYNMMIRNAYGTRRVSNSSILYSVSADNPLRHVVNVMILEQDLLMCRNRILGIMHLLAETPDKFFKWLGDAQPAEPSPISVAKYEKFKNLGARLSAAEWEWFLASVQRAVREIWFVKTGDNGSKSESSFGHNALWQLGKAEKQANYRIITGLKPLSTAKNLIRLELSSQEEIADFREGDIVVLYAQNTPVTKQEILRGIIRSLNSTHLELQIRGGLKNSQRLSEISLWAMEHDTLETSLYAPLSSLTQFLKAPSRQRSLFLGLEKPSFAVNSAGALTEVETILTQMHNAQDLFLVQGPPGTGKTSGLLSTYISQVFRQTDKTLLILSFTNRAVDEICLNLDRQKVPYIRTGTSQAVSDRLLSNLISGKRFEQIESTVKSNRIWVSTVQSAAAWYLDMLRIVKFDEIIVDEASQIIESSILGIISQAPKTILIGDQNQLPPITVQSPLPYGFAHPELKSLAFGSYSQSLMERLYRVHSVQPELGSTAMLRNHYRMHSSIAELVSHNYQDRLVAVRPEQFAPLQTNPHLPDFLNQRIVWIDCPVSTTLHYDAWQADIIVKVIHKLQTAGEIADPGTDIGIVAPFRAMIHLLRRKLAGWNSLTIDTVERFQGSERRIIILCLPLRHESDLQQVQSISEDGRIDRKLNVALSRAMDRLIILGNQDMCAKNSHYGKLIDKIGSQGIMVKSDLADRELN